MLFLESWMNGTQLDGWLIDLHVTTIAKNAKNNVSKNPSNLTFSDSQGIFTAEKRP